MSKSDKKTPRKAPNAAKPFGTKSFKDRFPEFIKETPKNSLLAIAMSAAVPLQAMVIQEKWRTGEYDWNTLNEIAEIASHALANHGDDLLFRSRERGQTAKVFNAVAKGVAVLSFWPNGVEFCGMRFQNFLPDREED